MKTITKSETKLAYGQSNPLPVMEHFYTLQGEGSWTGEPCYFIRLAGCDVGCHWCDVKESWNVASNQNVALDQLVQWVKESGSRRVVITGGEPTIYDLGPLCKKFHQHDIIIHIETAGPHAYTGEFDWICLSPKKFLPPLKEYYQLAHELKIVIYNAHDFKWAELHADQCGSQTQLFLQPEWSRKSQMTPLIIDYIKQNPKWRLSQQTHKYLDIP